MALVRLNGAAGKRFVILVVQTGVINILVKQIDGEDQAFAQEPRLGEGNLVILQLGADGGRDLEFLARPGKGGRIEQIKVALLELDESDDALHRVNPAPTVKLPVLFSSTPMTRSLRLGTSVSCASVSTFEK